MKVGQNLVWVATCLFLSGASSCDRYRHPLRAGSLSEVAAPSIQITWIENHPNIFIGNEAANGTCLRLEGIRVVVDGMVQTLAYAGGRNSGQTKVDWGPVNKTDFCDAARVAVSVPNDPSRAADIVEVSEGATSLRAEFPNVLAKTIVVGRPSGHAGDVVVVRVQPELARGTGKFDPPNLTDAFFGRKQAHASLSPSGDIALEIPPGTPPGATAFSMTSVQKEIAARRCTAASCSAESDVFAQGTILVAP